MASYSTNVINISLLKQYQNTFSQDKDKFNNDTYATFRSSYLNTCSDGYVSRMSSQLNSLYSVIQNSYTSINDWWSNYNNNAQGLENYLSNSYSSSLTESSLIGYVNSKLPKLKEKVFDVSTFSYFNNSNIIKNVSLGMSKVGVTITDNIAETVSAFSSVGSGVFSKIGTLISEENIKKYKATRSSEKDDNKKNVSTSSNRIKVNKNVAGLFGISSYVATGISANIFSNVSTLINDDNIKKTCAVVSRRVTSTVNGMKSYAASVSSNISKVSKTVVGSFSKATGAVTSLSSRVISNVSSLFSEENVKKACAVVAKKVTNTVNDVKNFTVDAANWYFGEYIPKVNGVVCKNLTTAGLFAVSLGEGFLVFSESLGDFVSIVGTAGASVGTGIWDLGQFIGGKITGEEWESVTKKMWKSTMDYVAPSYLKDEFDSMYENTEFGKFLKDNSYGFDITRSVGTGVGQVGGIIVVAVATAGIGGVALGGGAASGTAATTTTISSMANTLTPYLASVGAASRFGQTSETAWASGATMWEGLSSATVAAGLEAGSWLIGGKINASKAFLGKGALPSVKNKIANSIFKISLDTGVGACESFTQPIPLLFYTDGYYDENNNYVEFSKIDSFDSIKERYSEIFDDNGGYKMVATNALVSLIGSGAGEIFDIGKVALDNHAYKILDDQIIKANNITAGGGSSIIEVKNIESIPSDLWNKIKNPDKIIFKVGDKQFTYAQAANIYMLKNYNVSDVVSDSIESINDTLSDLNIESEVSTVMKNLDDEIAKANYYTGKGNFYTIDVASLDDIPSDIFDKLNNSTNVQFRVGDKIYKSADVQLFLSNNGAKLNSSIDSSISINKLSAKEIEKIIEDKIEQYNKLVDIKDSLEYKIYKDSLDKGYAIKYNEVYHNLEKNMLKLVQEMDDLDAQYKKLINAGVLAEYNGDLKKYIFDKMPSDLNPLEEARYIYWKLNKEVSYSSKWIGTGGNLPEQYFKKMDISNYYGEDIVCSNWSEMYSELLDSAGIENYVRGGTDLGNHKWVVFKIDDKYFMADATQNFISGGNDIARIQSGYRDTYGFVQISENAFYDNQLIKNMKNATIEINGITMDYLKYLNGFSHNILENTDRKIGFNYDEAYELFKNNGNSLKDLNRLGLDENSSILDVVTKKMEIDILPKLKQAGVMEGLPIFNILKTIEFSPEELRMIDVEWVIDNSSNTVSALYHINGGKTYLYGGKNDVKIVDEDFWMNYNNYGYRNYNSRR